uniref:Uncharacterized protein n=1 Tax=Erythrolobus australicus TaxID=1077150 RepID=A0A7S1XGV9_9RHOD
MVDLHDGLQIQIGHRCLALFFFSQSTRAPFPGTKSALGSGIRKGADPCAAFRACIARYPVSVSIHLLLCSWHLYCRIEKCREALYTRCDRRPISSMALPVE